MMRVVMLTEMSWQVNEEVSWDMTGKADGMNQGADSRCISEQRQKGLYKSMPLLATLALQTRNNLNFVNYKRIN